MARQTWMAQTLRAAGLTVVEVSGWTTRGDESFAPIGIVQHETRGAPGSTISGEINVLVNGREGLDGPIAAGLVDRTGVWHLTSAGRSNHVKTGWGGPFAGKGNSSLLGIEAHHSAGESWGAIQYRSCVRGFAAICRHMGWTADRVIGHKEHQPGDKPDPEFDMNQFRRDVAAAMDGDDMTPAQEAKLDRVEGRLTTIFYGLDVNPYGEGPMKDEPNRLKEQLSRIEERPAAAPAPVDGATLAAALRTPEAQEALRELMEDVVKRAFQGGADGVS